MVRTLLVRGMLIGFVAGLVMFAFARWAGEPQVDRAVAFEASMDQARGELPEPEMVSRKTQKSFGLLTGTAVYGTALGGIFGLVFAYSRGRLTLARPRVLSALIGTIGFVTIVLIPSLKYPANPPSVGNPDTIGIRTAAYFLLIAISILLMALALKARRHLSQPLGTWNASILAGLFYGILVSVCDHFLPVIDEVPPAFPASLLWEFRIASWETQAVLWTVLCLVFGWLSERAEGIAQTKSSLQCSDKLHST